MGLLRSAQNAEQSKGRATQGAEEASAATAEIDLLAAASGQISSITEIIAGVTRQTQLLVINARVEAARAGESGRGFCVVADEVKTLAARTRGATEGISDQVRQVGTVAVASNIAQAEEIARSTEAIATDVVETAGVLKVQADSLQNQVADFVLRLRSVAARGSGATPSAQASPASSASSAALRRRA